MKCDYFMTKQLVSVFKGYVSHNMIPNLLPNSKD